MNGSYELKLARLMRYALKRSKEAGNPDAEKWRGVFRLSLRATRQVIAGELAPERLTALDPFFKRYAIDGRADGGAGSGNWGHEGRPGKRGGSAPGGGSHNRMTAEGGGFTSFSKIQKSYATPHTFNASDSHAISWKTGGTKLVVGGTAYAYHPKSDSFEGPGGTLYASSHFNGKTAKVLVPKSSSPNYNKSKGMTVEEGKKKFQSAFTPKSAEEADDAYRAKSGEVWRNCDQETKEALHSYTSSGYIGMNKALRAGNKGDSYTAAKIDRATDAISKSKLEKDCILYRGVNQSGFEKMMKLPDGSLTPDKLQDLIGKHGVEDGFMSTGSAKGKGFSKAVKMEILAPKGTQALYVEPFSACGGGYGMNWDGVRNDGKSKQTYFGGEQETIVQRASSLMILSAKYSSGRYHIQAVITEQNPK